MMEKPLNEIFSIQYYIVLSLLMIVFLMMIWTAWQFTKRILKWLAD